MALCHDMIMIFVRINLFSVLGVNLFVFRIGYISYCLGVARRDDISDMTRYLL